MSDLTEINLKLTQIITWMNNVDTQKKKNDEFSLLDLNTESDFEVRVYKDGVSKRIPLSTLLGTNSPLPVVTIGTRQYFLFKHKDNALEANKYTLEPLDVCIGQTPAGDFLIGTYLVGDPTDLDNGTVWDRFNGTLNEI